MTDLIPPMREPYMNQIIAPTKDYEFSSYALKSSVGRAMVLYYHPTSAINQIAEIGPAVVAEYVKSLPVEGITENRQKYRYNILRLQEIKRPIPLKEWKGT
ncbi:hypothetical protein BDZ91DRAFT_797113 [Kalaharituber pfeilii]|nr:hypothetical protein BDZ91DRAFT_797113 [Kalaharituber pfeilii]